MRNWYRQLLRELHTGHAAMVVHVVEAKGSIPREAGARMIVTEASFTGTIGGGQLEYEALATARRALCAGGAGAVEGHALGPALSQCCGGVATLAYEPFSPADGAWIERLIKASEGPFDVYRTVRIGSGGLQERGFSTSEDGFAGTPEWAVDLHHDLTPGIDLSVRTGLGGGSLGFLERANPVGQPLWIFGAGHVGQAVVKALADLPFDITWIDGRAGMFPEAVPSSVRVLELAMPELIVDEAPKGTMFLVMTHSHPLDQDVCEAVLRRGDATYVGLIGSETKRARFRKRLSANGITADTLDTLVCPIGRPEIKGKEPATIAASVAADLLIRLEETQGIDVAADTEKAAMTEETR